MGDMQEIGLQLKEQREEKGLALADIAKSTKISIRLLKSIEAGDFGALPAGVFARNFVRQYCNAIEVEPEPILEKVFAVEPEFTEPEDIQEKKSHRAIIGIIVLLLLAAGAFWLYQRGIWNSVLPAEDPGLQPLVSSSSPAESNAGSPPRDEKTAKAIPQQKDEVAGRKLSTKTLPLQSTGETSGKVPGVQQTGSRLNVSGSAENHVVNSSAIGEQKSTTFPVRFEADEKCWIHLRCPEKEMDFILMKGELYTTTCSAPAIISVGNAEYIRIFVNNKKVVFPSGQRVVKNFVLREIGQNRD